MRATRWLPTLAAGLVLGCASQLPAGLPGLGPSGMGPTGVRLASPRPTLTLDPPYPCPGQRAAVHGEGAAADAPIEFWLLPETAGGFKAGLPHPRELGGTRLGETRTDAAGRFDFAFTVADVVPRDNRPAGMFALWLTFPDGDMVAPVAAAWDCPPAETLVGAAYDARGERLRTPGEVRVVVESFRGTTIFDRRVPLADGRYRAEGVPLPGRVTLTASVPGWPARTRQEGEDFFDPRLYDDVQGPEGLRTGGRKASPGPIAVNFGGPADPADPDAPAFFLAPDLDAPAMATTTVTGRVYDLDGRPLPDALGARVLIGDVIVPVVGGAYAAPGVPTGEHLAVDLRTNLVYPQEGFSPFTRVFVPEAVRGAPNVMNFGGPATPADADAPRHPFPSPHVPSGAPSPLVP